MLDEIGLHKMQEDSGFGEFLLQTIADLYGTEPNEKSIDRAVYKNTACGAWARFDEHGILVGTIVEGSDAEHSQRIDLTGIEPGDEGAALLVKRFREAIQGCEDFSDEVWGEMVV